MREPSAFSKTLAPSFAVRIAGGSKFGFYFLAIARTLFPLSAITCLSRPLVSYTVRTCTGSTCYVHVLRSTTYKLARPTYVGLVPQERPAKGATMHPNLCSSRSTCTDISKGPFLLSQPDIWWCDTAPVNNTSMRATLMCALAPVPVYRWCNKKCMCSTGMRM